MLSLISEFGGGTGWTLFGSQSLSRLNECWVLMSWVSNRLRDLDNFWWIHFLKVLSPGILVWHFLFLLVFLGDNNLLPNVLSLVYKSHIIVITILILPVILREPHLKGFPITRETWRLAIDGFQDTMNWRLVLGIHPHNAVNSWTSGYIFIS
jgi:hypothetical protein